MNTEKNLASITVIVAIDSQRGIGINNTLPWRLPEDLAHFKRTTSGHTVVMGRKTFESIGRPLPNRRNIVVTRNAKWSNPGVEAANSLEEALGMKGTEEVVFVIGGAQIFAESLPLANKLIVTEIDKAFECDTFFPETNHLEWKETHRETHYSDLNGCSYAFVTYERNRTPAER